MVSDIIALSITGKWSGNRQTYVGSFIGGLVGGALVLTGNIITANMANAAIATFLGAGTVAIFSKAFDKITGKLLKSASVLPGLNRLAGRGSYDAAFRMVYWNRGRKVI